MLFFLFGEEFECVYQSMTILLHHGEVPGVVVLISSRSSNYACFHYAGFFLAHSVIFPTSLSSS
jgi:hypothetical protein